MADINKTRLICPSCKQPAAVIDRLLPAPCCFTAQHAVIGRPNLASQSTSIGTHQALA